MDRDIATRWVKALRSGRYKQAKEHLASTAGMCCLGVLCTILRTRVDKSDDAYWEFGIERNRLNLPAEVQARAGIKSRGGVFYSLLHDDGKIYRRELSALNDSGKSFAEIADMIEKNWELL